MITLLLVLCLVTCVLSVRIDSKDLYTKEAPNFILTYPRVLIAGSLVPVCLTLYDAKLPANLSVAFKNSKCSRKELCGNIFQITEDHTCVDVNVPKIRKAKNQTGFSVHLETNNKKIRMDIVSTVHKHDYMKIFLRTDKYNYRRGELVNIRIMAVPDSFLPVASYVVPHIMVEDPVYNNVKIWENVSVTNGFAQLQYNLSRQARVGRYKVLRDEFELGAFSGVFYVNKEKYAEFNVIQMGRLHNNSLQVMLCSKYQNGINVPGDAILTVRTHNALVQRTQKLRAGCSSFAVPIAALGDRTTLFELEGLIAESGTNAISKKKAYIKDTTADESMIKFINKHDVIKPGLPFVLKLLFARELKMFTNKLKICYGIRIHIRRHYYLNCITLPLVVDQIVEVTIPPIRRKQFTDELVVNGIVAIPNQDIILKKFKIAGSKNYKSIAIRQRLNNDETCHNTAHFDILLAPANTTETDINIHYTYSSNGRKIKAGNITGTPEIHDWKNYTNVIKEDVAGRIIDRKARFYCVVLNLSLEEAFTEGSLLVHTLINGEVLDDEIGIIGQSCLPVSVEVDWLNPKSEVDTEAVLEVRTNKDAVCAVTAVDKSTIVDTNNDDYMPLTQVNLFKTVRDIHDYANRRLCQKKFKHHNLLNRGVDEWNIDPLLGGTKQSSKVQCREIKYFDGTTVEDGDMNLERELIPRSGFSSSTLVWDIIDVSANKPSSLNVTPHMVGTWSTSAICLSKTDGIGISPSTELLVNKPFTLTVTTPPTLRLNIEVLRLPVTVTNYDNITLPIKISIETQDGLESINGEPASYCVVSHDSKTHYYMIKAVADVPLNVTVVAEITKDEACLQDQIEERREVAENTIEVTKENDDYHLSRTTIVCTKDITGIEKWTILDLILPKTMVGGKQRGRFAVRTNFMAPIMDFIDTMFPLVTGNCEQAISRAFPSLYLLKYMTSVERPMDEQYNRTLLNIETVYQDMLGYLWYEGQFAAFGNGNEMGSLFLSCSALKVLRYMKPYMFVDDEIVNDTLSWILKHQMPNGCFQIISAAFDQIEFDTVEKTPALTAYVMISLFNSEVKLEENVTKLAQTCIKPAETSDKFTKIIGIHALALMGVNVTELFDEQMKKFKPLPHYTYWQNPQDYNTSLVNQIKIASYLILTAETLNRSYSNDLGSYAYRWLQSQLISGYGSTWPTVLALEAVYRFAQKFSNDSQSLRLTAVFKRSGYFEQNYRPKTIHQDANKTFMILFFPEQIRMRAVGVSGIKGEIHKNEEGHGCVLVQAHAKLKIKSFPLGEYFKLETEARPVFISTTERCYKIQLIICAKVANGNVVNMGMFEIAVPTGYVWDDEMDLHSDILYLEQVGNILIAYTRSLSKAERCVTVIFKRKLMVKDIVNPTVKVYDYTKPDVFVKQVYQMPDCKLQDLNDESNANGTSSAESKI